MPMQDVPDNHTNRQTSLEPVFVNVASNYAGLHRNVRDFLQTLHIYQNENQVNTDEAEQTIRVSFESFLKQSDFHMAMYDFGSMIDYANQVGRSDGTKPWYHQFTNMVCFLSLVAEEKITFEMLEPYGGLETAIRSILHHDTFEDIPISKPNFLQNRYHHIQYLYDAGEINQDKKNQEYSNAKYFWNNLMILTKKDIVFDESGQPIKKENGKYKTDDIYERDEDYSHNLIESKQANPVAFLIKIFDMSHNGGTAIGAPKFVAQKRENYFNHQENMFGKREGITAEAIKKWPEFAQAIKAADNHMGAILYTNFGYIKYVDQLDPTRYRDGQKIRKLGISDYLSEGKMLDLPPAFDPLHLCIGRIASNRMYVNDAENREKMHVRSHRYLEESVYPLLQEYDLSNYCVYPLDALENDACPTSSPSPRN